MKYLFVSLIVLATVSKANEGFIFLVDGSGSMIQDPKTKKSSSKGLNALNAINQNINQLKKWYSNSDAVVGVFFFNTDSKALGYKTVLIESGLRLGRLTPYTPHPVNQSWLLSDAYKSYFTGLNTGIGEALKLAFGKIKAYQGAVEVNSWNIIILTDGQDTTSPPAEPPLSVLRRISKAPNCVKLSWISYGYKDPLKKALLSEKLVHKYLEMGEESIVEGMSQLIVDLDAEKSSVPCM